MKKFYSFGLQTILLILMVAGLFGSCNKPSNNILEENKILSKDSLLSPLVFYCSGNKECLPNIDVQSTPPNSSTPGVTISWSIPSTIDHQYTISITGLTDYYQYINTSGSMFFSTNDDAYKLAWSLSCTSFSCDRCVLSRAYIKKSNEDDGTIGSFKDCQKEYLDYQAETSYHTIEQIKIECKSPMWMQEDEDNYLNIDSYEIFTANYGEPLTSIHTGAVVPGVTDIWLPNAPIQSYEMRLYSSDCEHNDEHYLYKTYQGTGGTGLYVIDPYSFQTVNAHETL